MRFDGRTIAAHPGDTLASALLANGNALVARSFKYHRPRGVYTAGVEEPNALVSLGTGAHLEPNTRATVIEAYDGLEATSQNRWPSLALDLGAVNNLAARFLPAGFYYKTFIGPGRSPRAWMFYEKFIRRAAGMGRAVKIPDPDQYEKVNGFCDVLVIGAGPAGLCAALAAGRAGARVVLAEQDFEIGGSLLSEPVDGAHAAWLASVADELASLTNVRVMARTAVFGAYGAGVFGCVERAWDHVAMPPAYQPRQRFHLIRAKTAVLATGAIEQPVSFGGNDLPGVMLASSVRTYLHRFGVLPGRKIVVVTDNDSGFPAARDLARAGATVSLIDVRPDIDGPARKLLEDAGVEVAAGHAVLKTRGKRRVVAVDVVPVDAETDQATGEPRALDADLVAVSGGWSPSLHLWSQLGHRPAYDSSAGVFFPDFVPGSGFSFAGLVSSAAPEAQNPAGWFAIGAAVAHETGIDGSSGEVPSFPPEPLPGTRRAAYRNTPPPTDNAGSMPGKIFVDLQHDVTIADVELAHREGLRSVEHVKRYTTTGMATDQGKTANLKALGRMAALQDAAVDEVGTTRFRPPYTPFAFGAVAGYSRGLHIAPTRLSAIHDWHDDRGAAFVPAGAWQRPWYYPRDGERIGEAYVREAEHVRAHVGLVDVSTLGKIALQGPDAREFLDRVYANGFKSLEIGRIRYGVMLREDGLVLDDGTTARLGEHDYFMSTTTANAARVLSHLEFLHQTRWPELKLIMTSVTDQWAAIAVAGPKSRALLQEAAAGADLSANALPNMTLTEAKIDCMDVRIHRMSFSGELAYEVYVGSGHGHAVWETLMCIGASYEVLPYGTEAMGTLRIEKGHVSAPELDGRTALGDLGMERMAGKTKPFVGGVLLQRDALWDLSRPQLVGLEALNRDAAFKPGMLLFPEEGETTGHGEGFVSSATWSPALDNAIALGLLARGPERHGETIRCVDLLSGTTVVARVASPHFFDPEGERQNG